MPAADNTDQTESPEEIAGDSAEDHAAITPVVELDLGELSTHHDDLENPDAELSEALSVDSLSMTTFKMQPRIN